MDDFSVRLQDSREDSDRDAAGIEEDDLLLEVANLAKEGRFDYLLIESTGISEPLPVAVTFTFESDAGIVTVDGEPQTEGASYARDGNLVTFALGGQIQVESTPGLGTTVRLTLPLISPEARRAALYGWSYAPLVIDEVLKSVKPSDIIATYKVRPYADSRDFKWNNYIGRYHTRHLDLMDLLALYQPRANAPLDAMAELEALLFRRDDGELFHLPAYRELLFLYAVVRDLVERGEVDAPGGIDLLLDDEDVTGLKPILRASGDPERLTRCRWSTDTRLVCEFHAVVDRGVRQRARAQRARAARAGEVGARRSLGQGPGIAAICR